MPVDDYRNQADFKSSTTDVGKNQAGPAAKLRATGLARFLLPTCRQIMLSPVATIST